MNFLLTETGMGSWSILIIFVVVLAVMIIPQYIRSKKENTKRQETMSQLKAGDSIITNAGVFGRIVSMRETTIGRVYVIETGDANHKSYQEIHADAIMGVDTKKDIILDANGNDITFADEDKKEEEVNNIIEENAELEKKTSEELEKEVLEETKESKTLKTKKSKK